MSTALMGIMAVPILLELNAIGVSIAPAGVASAGKLSELWKGAMELLRVHKKLWFISSLIGYIIGVIPALGSSTAIWLAYGRAKQTSSHPEEFGKGSPEGIVAPESCNNAVEGGALLTTLVFGIPGSSIMVVLLAAFLMMGVQPGPKMIVENTAICFLMLLSVAVSNIIAGVTCFFGSTILLKTTRLNPVYLYATLIPLICISAFVGRGYVVDLLVITLITFLGLCLRRYGFSAPALILGFVLGRLFEYYLLLSLDLRGPLFMFSSPICVILIALIFISVFWDKIMIGLQHIFKGLVKES
jgi:putative tricarboxylic transport membrane protein